jgi:hypothetical protein
MGRKNKTDKEIHDVVTDPLATPRVSGTTKVHARKPEKRKISEDDINHEEESETLLFSVERQGMYP